MSEETARKIGEQARKYDIQISVHAPYYINLANPENIDNNYRYIASSIRLMQAMDGERLVVHLGAQGKLPREQALENVASGLRTIIRRLDAEGLGDFLMCIETMGQYSRIGNVAEVCDFCKIDKRIIPTLDFGHINCLLQGELKTNFDKIPEIMDFVESKIGSEKLKKVHIHWSAIEFSKAGETKHTTLDDEKWNFSHIPLFDIIRQKGLQPTIICESMRTMVEDAERLAREFMLCTDNLI